MSLKNCVDSFKLILAIAGMGLFSFIAPVFGQFSYSPNQYPQAGNVIINHFISVETDGYGNKYLTTFVMPRVISPNLQPIGEGFFHVWEYLDFLIGNDPLATSEPLVFGHLDESLFSINSIQLTPHNEQGNIMVSPVGWTLILPIAWVCPIANLPEGPPSSSFFFEPFFHVGSPAIMTSSTLIPPSMYGLILQVEQHTIINFYSEIFGSGYGVLTTQRYITL